MNGERTYVTYFTASSHAAWCQDPKTKDVYTFNLEHGYWIYRYRPYAPARKKPRPKVEEVFDASETKRLASV